MKIPKIRFPGFTEEWEKQRLSNILEFEYGMNAAGKEFDGENKYIRITDIEESSRKFLQTKLVSPEGKVTEKYRVKFGDILFARTGASTGKTYKYIDNDGKIYFAGFLIRGRVDKKTSVDFIFYLTLNYKYKSWINVMSMRSGQPGINAKEYGSYEFRIPKIEEQQKIGDFFTLLDKRIEQQEQKIALLKDYKKAMMQKIFSQKIRFKDENGNDYPDWEEKKFLNIFFSIPSRAYQIFKTEIFSNGKIPVVDQGKKKVAGYSNEIEKICDKTPCIVFGDHTTELKYIDFPFIIGADGTKILRNHIANSTLFLYYLLLENNVEQEGYKRHFSILTKKSFDIPMIKEQEKIASFLSSIDFNIENQEGILENLKTQKGVLLHKMFI